ncbi:MAG: triose-phosphate isomerase [Acidobacteria bacterium]|nr:triose-phosphate isomerase [Acidobacteriota bacterium]
MSRIPFIVGNWKMYKNASSAMELCDQLRTGIRTAGDREVGVAPPLALLPLVQQRLENSRIRVGGQNVHPQAEGAFTGEVSAEMLASVGCSFVIIGHSERRQHFNEGDSFLGAKLLAAFRAQLDPIFCLGETLQERESGATEGVIRRQLDKALASLTPPQASRIIVAYEPVWAIGTGRTATPETAQQVHHLIREYFRGLCGIEGANRLRILYGGSVKPDNVDGLMAQPDIDGTLVGGASLNAADFARIVDYRT